ncbi:tetratricopeptide repeat protein [Cyclobacterium plantarum]|uniref:Tetratricopeptide repeat protein n=1 Tax=Cyclobacterium plantarum TaxID=2716263 RepID=A0ABX0H2N8_9BACT|nr:hypothetical protein [Cyclobacterium plantarum]NHE55752.1 hypothetical protein [Cyclobacterium plantarum]
MESKIDLGEPINFGLVYALFQKLITKYHPDYISGKTNKSLTLENTKKVQEFSQNIEDASSQNQQRVGLTTVKSIIAALKGNPHGRNEPKLAFDLETINALCHLVGNPNWESFSTESKAVALAETIILENREIIERYRRFTIVRNKYVHKPTIYFNFRASSNFGTAHQILKTANREFQDRLIRSNLKDTLELIFTDDNESVISDGENVSIAKSKNADVAVWGYFDVVENGELWAQVNYAIIGSSYENRISKKTSYFPEMKISFSGVRNGEFYTSFDHAIQLIIAIETILRDEFQTALSHLAKIPDNQKCAESWFIQGTCLYELGRESEGVECWENALKQDENHLKSITNLAMHLFRDYNNKECDINERAQISKALRLLQNPLFDDAPAEIKLRVGSLFAELGEKKHAISYLNDVVKDKQIPAGAEYAWLKLGQLENKPENFKKAALLSDEFEFHKICKSLIEGSGLDKRRIFEEIYRRKRSDPRLRELYEEKDFGIAEHTDQFPLKIFDLTGKIDLIPQYSRRLVDKNVRDNVIIKEIDGGLYYDDIIICGEEEVSGTVLLCDEQGRFSDILRLKIPAHRQGVTTVADCLYSYFENLRSTETKDAYLFLEPHIIRDEYFLPNKLIKLINKSNKEFITLETKRSGELVLDKDVLGTWYKEGIESHLSLEIQLQTDSIEFYTLKNLNLFIPIEMMLKEKVKNFTDFLHPANMNEFYLAIANYLTDVYAYVEMEAVRNWIK